MYSDATIISVSVQIILPSDESEVLIARCTKNRGLSAARSTLTLLFCGLLNVDYEG